MLLDESDTVSESLFTKLVSFILLQSNEVEGESGATSLGRAVEGGRIFGGGEGYAIIVVADEGVTLIADAAETLRQG